MLPYNGLYTYFTTKINFVVDNFSLGMISALRPAPASEFSASSAYTPV
jgi:hypothetical protein